jgi:hypothetical protein
MYFNRSRNIPFVPAAPRLWPPAAGRPIQRVAVPGLLAHVLLASSTTIIPSTVRA